MPRYEFSEGTSNKFWEISLSGKSFTTTYGKIGTSGSVTLKEFDSEAQAKKEYDKLIAEKTKKGYELVSGSGAGRASPKAKDDDDDDDDEDEKPAPKKAGAKAAPPAAAKKAAPAKAGGGGRSTPRRFEFSEGTSNKFWEIWLEGTSVMTKYGRIGSDGSQTVKDFGDDAKATKEYDKLVAEKTKKGYEEVGGGGGRAAAKADDDDDDEDEKPKAAAKKAAPPAKPAAKKASNGGGDRSTPRYFEFSEGTSNKFWQIWLEGTSVMTKYGRIGAAGSQTVKDFGDEAKAIKEYDKLLAEKTKKGYEEADLPD